MYDDTGRNRETGRKENAGRNRMITGSRTFCESSSPVVCFKLSIHTHKRETTFIETANFLRNYATDYIGFFFFFL